MITLNQLAQLGIGTSRVASLGNRLSSDAFTEFLKTATERGVNLIDTSDFYGSGDAERLIGRCLGKTGYPFFVMTKAGLPRVHAPGWLSPLNQIGKKLKQRTGARKNFTAAYLIDSVHKSNQRMGIPTADALLLHEPTWSDLADADCWDGLTQIRQQGLARYTGVSTNDYRVVDEGIRSGQVQVVQTATAWHDNSTRPILELCRTHGIPVIGNQVLRPYKDLQDQFNRQISTIQQIDELANMSLVQFLIAAPLAGTGVKSVLFGTSDLAHLRHNIGALQYVNGLSSSLPALTKLLSA